MRHSVVPLAAAALALLLGSTFGARALDQEQSDSLSRFISGSYAAADNFGAVGEVLKNVGKGAFIGAGTGSFKRDLARGWNDAFESARGVSQAMGEKLSYKITSQAVSDADWATPLGAASAGDVRGTVSGATQIMVGGQATAGGSALFGAIGTGAGFAVGSFFPVVGNVVGAEVGGAIGTVAGGFISSYAYDKFLKDMVGKGVEAGIAALFDADPLQQAMQARQAFLHQTVSPEVAAQLEVSLSFGSGEAQVLDWERVPYIVTPKQALPQAPATPSPDAQQQAALPPATALPPGGPSTVTGDIQIDLFVPFNCTIAGGAMRCEGSSALGSERWRYQFEGTISGSTAIGYQSTVHEQRYQSGCGYRDLIRLPARYDFEDGGQVRMTSSEGPVTVLSNTCAAPPPIAKHVEVGSSVHTWRARQ
jgi:hypothetical protein